MRTKSYFYAMAAATVSVVLLTSFSDNGAMKYPTGAPAGYTGSPGDGNNCTACHGGTPANTSGIITTNIPVAGYVAGNTYQITVTVSGTGNKGFLLSPQDAQGIQIGTLVAGSGTSTLANGKYITHTSASNVAAATWSFNWQAPAQPGTNNVTFYCAHVRNKTNVFLSNLTIQEKLTTGMDENTRPRLAVWPNPARDFIKFSLPENSTETPVISLVSSSGEVVYQARHEVNYRVNPAIIRIPENIPNGIYVLKIQSGSYLNTSKVFITR